MKSTSYETIQEKQVSLVVDVEVEGDFSGSAEGVTFMGKRC